MINSTGIVNAILTEDNKESLVSSITEGADTEDEPLNYNTSLRNTEMAQEIYGENIPPITTKGMLQEADEMEAMKIAEENQTAEIESDVKDIAEGTIDTKTFIERAKQNSLNYLKTVNMGDALAVSNARQLSAEAEVGSAAIAGLSEEDKKQISLVQEKEALLREFFTRMLEGESQGGILKAAGRRISHAFWGAFAGYDQALASTAAAGASAGITHPVENEFRISEMWWGAVNDPRVSTETLADTLRQYNEYLDSQGFSISDKSDVAAKVLNPSPNATKFNTAMDVLGLGASVGSVVKTVGKAAAKEGIKAGIKAGVKATITEAAQSVAPVKSFAKEDGLVVKVTEKAGNSRIGRALKFGNKDKAVEETINNLPNPSLKRDLVQVETETGLDIKRQEIYEAYIGDAIDVGENSSTHIATNGKILTEKALRQRVKKTLDALEYLEKETGSIKALEKETWDKVAEKVAIDINQPELVELIKAVPADDLGLDVQGNIMVRVRYPQEFSSASDAQTFIDTLDRTEVTPKLFRNTTGTYSVDLDIATDHSFIDFSKNKKESWSGREKSYAFTFSSVPKDIRELDMARLAEDTKIQSIFSETSKAIEDLDKAEKKLLDAIRSKEVQNKAFFKPEQLLKAGVSDKVVNAHALLRATGDIEFFIRNDSLRRLWNRMGIRLLTTSDGLSEIGYGTIKQFSDFDSFKAELMKHKNVSFYNSQEDKVYKVSAIIDHPDLKEQFENLNLTLVNKVVDRSTNVRKKGVAMLAPRDALVEQDLPAFVLNYLPGGHKYFERGAGFIKQMDIRNGVMVGCKTIMIDSDKLGLTKRREALEELRLALGKKASDLEINKIIAKHKLPFENAAELTKFFSDKGIDIENADNVLEVLNHGELPSLYKNNMKTGWYEELADADYMQMQAKLGEYDDVFFDPSSITRSKVNRDIVDYAFNPVSAVDVSTMLKYVISDLRDVGLMRDYANIYAKKFYDTFRPIANLKTGEMSPLDFLYKTDFEKMIKGETNPVKKELMSQAITAQKNFEVIRGISSDADVIIADAFDFAIKSISGYAADALKLNDEIRHGIRVNWDKFFKSSKVSIMTGFATHTMLGCFNIKQLIKNLTGPLSRTISMEFVAGNKALVHLLPFMFRLNGQDAALLKRVRALEKLEGISSKTSDILLKNALKVGLELNHLKGGAVESVESMSNFGKASMFFFNKADSMNKAHSLLTALIAKGYDKKILSSAEEINMVRSYRDTLFDNMDRSGMSRMQNSQVARITLQFQNAAFRSFETMCFDRNLTAAQKRRLWISQLVLGGTTSVWGGAYIFSDYLYDKVVDAANGDEEVEKIAAEVKRTLDDGLLNFLVRQAGYNFSPANLFQLGVGDLAEDVLDMSALGIITSVPAVSAAEKFVDTFTSLSNWTYNKVMNRPAEEFSSLLKQLSRKGSLTTLPKDVEAAYSLMTAGARYNARGELSSEDNRLLNVVAGMLGMPEQTDVEVYRARIRMQKEKDRVSSFVKEWAPRYLTYCRDSDALGADVLYQTLDNEDFTYSQKSSIIKMLNDEAIQKSLMPVYNRTLIEQMNKKAETGKRTLF